MNRLIPFFPREQIIFKPKEQKLIKVEAPFVDEIPDLAIIKLLDINAQNTRCSIKVYLKFSNTRCDE